MPPGFAEGCWSSQAAEGALGSKPGEVRHFALGHEFRQQVGIQAVYAEDDHLA